MIILPAQLSELTGSSKANSMGSSLANSSPGSTQTRQTSNKDTINHVQTQTTQCKDGMLCWMRCGMRNARYDRKCMNLASTCNSKGATGKMGWDRLKTIQRMPESELRFGNGKRFKNDTGLRFIASRHLNAMRWTCYITQTWHQNTWQGCIHDA